MSSIASLAGSFSGCFCGMLAASTPLERVSEQRTEGCSPTDVTPSEYNVALNLFVQSGPRTVTFSLTFYTDKNLPAKLAKSVDLAGDLNQAPNPQNKYVLLLTNTNGGKSFLFNEISVIPSYDPNYDKDKPTQITVNFITTNLDPEYDLYTQGTVAELAAILGPRSPI